jgi:RNA polymerase-associated protein
LNWNARVSYNHTTYANYHELCQAYGVNFGQLRFHLLSKNIHESMEYLIAEIKIKVKVNKADRLPILRLYSHSDCPYCQLTRMVALTKDIPTKIIEIDLENKPEELLELNPYGTVPTLASQDLVIYETPIIVEYLEESYPHPPLFPVLPDLRSKVRRIMQQMYEKWFPLLCTAIFETNQKKSYKAKADLLRLILDSLGNYEEDKYFFGRKITIIDYALAVVLYRIRLMGIELPNRARKINEYADNLFSKDFFQESLLTVNLGGKVKHGATEDI